MIVKNIDNIKYDTLIKKARGILIDENDYLYVSKINDSYLFPGGGVEDGESDDETILRELEEEVGIKLDNLISLGTIIHYHEKFPNLKIDKNNVSNRINIIHYYFKKINSKDVGKPHYTEYELNNNLTIVKIKLDDLMKLITTHSEGYKVYTDEEILAALNLAKNKGYIK